MSVWTIVLIILVIALLGGFTGIGGSPLRDGLLRRWRLGTCHHPSARSAFDGQNSIANVIVGRLAAPSDPSARRRTNSYLAFKS